MMDLIASVLMLTGGAFSLVAAVGVVRFPDLFTRMHAATKSATMGVSCILLAQAIHFAELGNGARSLVIILFTFLTAPIAGHVIGRAGYISGVPMWEKSGTDDLRGRYDLRTHELASTERRSRVRPPRSTDREESGPEA